MRTRAASAAASPASADTLARPRSASSTINAAPITMYCPGAARAVAPFSSHVTSALPLPPPLPPPPAAAASLKLMLPPFPPPLPPLPVLANDTPATSGTSGGMAMPHRVSVASSRSRTSSPWLVTRFHSASHSAYRPSVSGVQAASAGPRGSGMRLRPPLPPPPAALRAASSATPDASTAAPSRL